MGLELRIIKDPCRDVPKPRFRTFGEQGGDIGRSPDRYWVLPDPKGYVSGQHCSIEYRDGTFWLRDTSRNGVFVNGSREPVGMGNEAPLHHGDRLRLAEYEVLVRLYSRHSAAPAAVGDAQSEAGARFGATGTAPRGPGDTGEHDVVVHDSAGVASSLNDRAVAAHTATATLNLAGRAPLDVDGDHRWLPEAHGDVANESAVAETEAAAKEAVDPATPGTNVARDGDRRPLNAGGDSFRQTTLDDATMVRNRVILALHDARALSAYKLLRTRVRRRMLANQWRSIGICGAAEGAGKTLTAINLAATFAQDIRSPCVLVDVDLHRPNVAANLGLQCDRGLTDYLLGDAEIADILYSPGVPGLTIVPNVRPLQSASELLASPRMTGLVKFLESLQPQRIIIYDLPPLLMSDDVLLFAPHMDCVLDVVAVGVTPRASLERSKEILAEFNVVGVVLNRATSQDKVSHYYY